MRIKIDQADKVFSQYIRLRDRQCMRCGSKVQLNEKGLPITHQASHYFGRGKESTRFEPTNLDTLCFPCHHYWGGEGREEYKAFKVKQLGVAGFKKLYDMSETFVKKDRALSLIYARTLLKELTNQKPS